MFTRVLVEECRPGTVEMLTRKVEETFLGPLREIPGFISYQVVKVDDRTLLALGVFETRKGAERMDSIGAEWRRDVGRDAIIGARPYIGEVIFEAGPALQEFHPSHAVGQTVPAHDTSRR